MESPLRRPAGAKLSSDYGKLPLAFEPNVGQTDARVRFLARGGGMTTFITDTETVMVLSRRRRATQPKESGLPQAAPREVEQAVVRMKLEGAGQPRRTIGMEKLPGISNYFIGNDPAKWRTDVPHYGRIQSEGVYPGIDLVWYGNQRKLEYDFVVAPGADPKQIQVAYEGVDSLQVEANGDLVLRTALGEVRQQKPRVYQEVGGKQVEVGARYAMVARNRVSFQLAEYDRKRELRIDPVVLVYSTYLGGSGDDYASGIAVDAAGSAYITGYTKSTDFPAQSPYQAAFTGTQDVFVTKLNADGTALLYSTYLGGGAAPTGGSQTGTAIAVDTNGAAYVAGYTNAVDFPYTPGAFQTGGPGFTGREVGFVSKLNATGSALSYSTFIGTGSGSGDTYAYAIAVDAAGFAYVTGTTEDYVIPVSATAIQRQKKGSTDAFVIKLNATGTGEVYGTYLGGSGYDFGYGIAVDSSGNVFIAGSTDSVDFPTQNPIQASNHCSGSNLYGNSGFVTKLNANGSALLYSTYLGGVNITRANAIAVDGSGNAYVTGVTFAPSGSNDAFPLQNALQPARGGGTDAFLSKINAAGTALVYSTYLGGSGDDSGLGVRVDGAGNAYVAGKTLSIDFPVANPFQPFLGGSDQIALKSVDGGTTWTSGSAGEPTGAVNALAVNPVTPSTLYAGTSTGRVYKSIDGGAHWSRSDSGLTGAPIGSLAIAASNTATLFAGTTSGTWAGVFKSTDGGSTWLALNSGPFATYVNALAVDPSDSNIVYAATGPVGSGGALYKSVNGGGTWTTVAINNSGGFTSLAIHPLTPQ